MVTIQKSFLKTNNLPKPNSRIAVFEKVNISIDYSISIFYRQTIEDS